MKKDKHYYERLDKRSKEYKDWKKLQEVLEEEVEELEEESTLSNVFNDKDREFLKEYFTRHNPNRFTKSDVFMLQGIYYRVFGRRVSITFNNASGIVNLNMIVDELKNLKDDL